MKSSNPTSNEMKEERISSKIIHKGKAFSFCSDLVRLPDGNTTVKDYVKYPEAVAILAFLDERKIILERQYRYPVGRLLYEIPAGKIDDPSETKENAAKRELLEETGFIAKRLRHLFSYLPAVGYSTEIIHVFEARELQKSSKDPDADEFIEVVYFDFDEVLNKIKSSEILDAKTIISVLFYERFFRT